MNGIMPTMSIIVIGIRLNMVWCSACLIGLIPHSSFHRYVRLGLLPQDWSGMLAEPKADYGELFM
jgi:hypothetical protein